MPVCKRHLFLWIKSLWVSTCFRLRAPGRCSIHTVRKRTGIHSAHHSADLSHSCVCVCARTSLCICGLCICVRRISSLWKQRTDIWSQSASVCLCACMFMPAFMNVRCLNRDYAYGLKNPGWFLCSWAEFIWIARAFLKPFVVDNLKMFEKGFADVASATTVIHFNTLTATHIGTHYHRYNGQLFSDMCALLLYATV